MRVMRDVVFVLVTLAFFALAASYVRACGRIIGPDEVTADEIEDAEAVDVAVPAR
jgi:rRNA processing protein Krr1/Pno1